MSVFTFYALYSFLLQRVVDGGFSDNIPHAKDIDDVITVSPFPGDFDICPEEDRHHNMKHFFHVANMELQSTCTTGGGSSSASSPQVCQS